MPYHKAKQQRHVSYPARIKMPELPESVRKSDHFSCDIYEHFFFHIRNSSTYIPELRIFEAIQSTAVHMGISNAFAAATLVELGLRAPRKAFPASFLDYADKIRTNKTFIPNRSYSLMALNDHWCAIRENYTFHTSPASGA